MKIDKKFLAPVHLNEGFYIRKKVHFLTILKSNEFYHRLLSGARL